MTQPLFSKALRILVADDHEINREVMSAMLNKLGYSADFVENGQQVIDKVVAGEQFDLFFIDLEMPVLDGYTTTEQIRQFEGQEELDGSTIIALSAHVLTEHIDKCKEVGMDDFLGKPIDLQRLREMIEQVQES